MKLIILLALFILVSALCQAQVVFGGVAQGKPELIIGDFHSFDLTNKDVFGFERYGFGRGQMEVTDRLGVSADNRSGVFLNSGDGYKLGLEAAVGSLDYRDRFDYQWEPGLSAGIRETVGGIGLFLGPRAGISYSNSVNDKFTGVVGQIQVFGVRASYWENNYKLQPGLKIYDLDLNNKVNIQKRIDRQETTTVSVRFEL